MVDIALISLTVLGLSLFEVVSSVDNAVINADVLSTMSKWARRWFLIWGLLIAVFLVRALLPFLIVYSINPTAGFVGTIVAAFSNDPVFVHRLERSAPPLLAAGGVFLVFLFLHWLFLEPKYFGLRGEEYLQKKGAWFFALVSIVLTLIIWYSLQLNPLIAFGASVGSSMFFITHGVKENATQREREMLGGGKMSDWSKILYLEVIDASFSIDGVLGAFAFTLSIPIILLGNGIGAVVVREVTVRNIENVRKYKYLKNGAMYSVAALGCIMILESFHVDVPAWISPIATISILSYFFIKSKMALKNP